MSTGAMIAILLGAAVILGFVSVLQLQHKYKKAVVGHILGVFLSPTGALYFELCKASGNSVEAPQRALASSPKIRTYIIREDRRFDTLYPPYFPKLFQVSAPAAVWYEGSQEPIDPRKGHDTPIVTPELWGNIVNEKFSSLMVRFGDEAQKIIDFVSQMPRLKLLYVLIGVAIVLGIVNIFFSSQVSSLLSRLASLWGM